MLLSCILLLSYCPSSLILLLEAGQGTFGSSILRDLDQGGTMILEPLQAILVVEHDEKIS